MSRDLTYSYAAIDHELKIVKPSGSVFSFPVLANVSDDIRALVARELTDILHDFVDWLDEPPADWAQLLNNLPPLTGLYTHAQALKEEDLFAYNGGPVRPQEGALSLSGAAG